MKDAYEQQGRGKKRGFPPQKGGQVEFGDAHKRSREKKNLSGTEESASDEWIKQHKKNRSVLTREDKSDQWGKRGGGNKAKVKSQQMKIEYQPQEDVKRNCCRSKKNFGI